MSKCPTHIYKLVPLRPTVDGYHDVSGYMCEVVVLLGLTAIPRVFLSKPSATQPSPNPTVAHPVVWRVPFPKDVVDSMVSWTKPQDTDNNSGWNWQVASSTVIVWHNVLW